ncbi:MAG: type II secretion system F family protein [Bacillota bacterium]|nr:type II secretion system F family protein [Bacillota bacterium]
MDTFRYTALSRDGKKVSGVMEGINQMDAVARIKEEYPVVVHIAPEKEQSWGSSFLAMDINGNRLNDKAFTLMCSQFAVILKAGIPIARTVRLICQKMTDNTLKKLLNKVADDVEAGRSLAASFADRGSRILPVTFLETVRAGEESGNLDAAFASASEHYTKQMKLRGKVRGAMISPTFVIALSVVVVIVLMVKVVPTFMDIFASQGEELPAITMSLIVISNFFRRFGFVLLPLVLALIIGVKIYGNTESGRLKLAILQLKLPILGNINSLSAASQFANTLAMMLGAGLPLTKAVSITSRAISNYYISTEVSKVAGELENGHSLGSSLRSADVLPDILVDMTAVGEESGELEFTLGMTAEYYDSELEAATAAALARLEPFTLVFMGAIAGYIVIAIYVAMFSMYNGM